MKPPRRKRVPEQGTNQNARDYASAERSSGYFKAVGRLQHQKRHRQWPANDSHAKGRHPREHRNRWIDADAGEGWQQDSKQFPDERADEKRRKK